MKILFVMLFMGSALTVSAATQSELIGSLMANKDVRNLVVQAKAQLNQAPLTEVSEDKSINDGATRFMFLHFNQPSSDVFNCVLVVRMSRDLKRLISYEAKANGYPRLECYD